MPLRTNPYAPVTPTNVVVKTKGWRGWFGRQARFDYANAKADFLEKARDFKTPYDAVKTAENLGQPIDATLQQEFEDAAREFNRAKNRLGYAEKKFLPSVKGMFISMAETVGIDTSNWHSKRIKLPKSGNIEDLEKMVAGTRGNFAERLLSKPFRLAQRFPVPAMVTGGVLAIVGIGSSMHRHAEQRTQDQVNAQMAEAQVQAQIAAQTQTVPATAQATYQIDPNDPALQAMNERLKGANGVPQTGHADAIAAARQQPPQPDGTPVAAL